MSLTMRERCAPGWDGHLMLLHTSESERRAGLAAWTRDALEHEEQVIYAERDSEPEARSLLALLDDHGIDGEAATVQRRLVRIAPDAFYEGMFTGMFGLYEEALHDGFRGVRVTAEVSEALAVMSDADHLLVEYQANELYREQRVSVLCQYGRRDLTPQRLGAVTTVHLAGIRERQLTSSDYPGGLSLAGEIDLANEDLLECALLAVAQDGGTTFSLDLHGVSFLGVGGVRVMESATREYRSLGGVLRVLFPQPAVEQTLRLLRFDQLPGVQLIGARR